mgnify:FL=1
MLAYTFRNNDPDKEIMLCIHGFMGTKDELEAQVSDAFVAYNTLYIDLPGHGGSPFNAEHQSMEGAVDAIKELLDALGISKLSLFGYSLGGRIAWLFSQRYPDYYKSLIIESAHPGFETEAEKEASWEEFIPKLEEYRALSFPDFLKQWYELPLFCKTKQVLSDEFLANKANGDLNRYLDVMAAYHVSKQPYLVDSVSPPCPIHYITGSLDTKYSKLANRLAEYGLRRSIIEDADHNVHLSQAKAFTILLRA